MIAAATGGPRINDINDQFQRNYPVVAAALARRGIENTLPYGNLWDWYGRWTSGDLPTYRSRREFVGELVNPLLNRLRIPVIPATDSGGSRPPVPEQGGRV
jgi:hypothetical protein